MESSYKSPLSNANLQAKAYPAVVRLPVPCLGVEAAWHKAVYLALTAE